MQPTPEQIARQTVDQHGGEYTTDVPDLLGLFGREQLTDKARREVRAALQSVDVGTDPDILVARRSDGIRLFLVQRDWVVSPRTGETSIGRALRARARPGTWKGWLAYAIVGLLVLGVLTQDSEDPKTPAPIQTIERSSDQSDAAAAAADRTAQREARRARARLRRERAELRRERAAARRARARARRAKEAARRERERQEQLAEPEAPAPAAPPAESSCHPSYDPCLDPNASDYDCEGGSGDGPEYTGFVTVKGPDDYGLDSDGDGTGCES